MTDVQKKPLGWLQIVGTLLVVAVVLGVLFGYFGEKMGLSGSSRTAAVGGGIGGSLVYLLMKRGQQNEKSS